MTAILSDEGEHRYLIAYLDAALNRRQIVTPQLALQR